MCVCELLSDLRATFQFRPGRGRCHLVPRAAPLAARPYSNAPRGHPRVAEGPRDRGHREGARVPSTLLPRRRARSLTPANARGPSADPKVHERDIFHSRVASRGADRPFLRIAFSTPSQARASPVSAASLALTFPQVTRGRAAPGPGAPLARRCRCRPSRERSAPLASHATSSASASCCYRTLRRLAGRAATTTIPNRGGRFPAVAARS